MCTHLNVHRWPLQSKTHLNVRTMSYKWELSVVESLDCPHCRYIHNTSSQVIEHVSRSPGALCVFLIHKYIEIRVTLACKLLKSPPILARMGSVTVSDLANWSLILHLLYSDFAEGARNFLDVLAIFWTKIQYFLLKLRAEGARTFLGFEVNRNAPYK